MVRLFAPIKKKIQQIGSYNNNVNVAKIPVSKENKKSNNRRRRKTKMLIDRIL